MTKKTFELSSDFTVKSVNTEANYIEIEGYANTTTKDRVGDVIIQEAWTKGGMDNYLKNPIVLAYHDYSKPIGIVTGHSVDSKGLKIVAKIFKKSTGNVFDFIKEGILRTFSVGFRVKDAEYDNATDIFVIKDLELFEISVVSVPANADSTFSVKKAFEGNQEEFDNFKKEFQKEVEDEVKTSDSIKDVIKDLEEKIAEGLNKNSEELNSLLEKLKAEEKEEENNMPDNVYTKDMVEDLLKEAESRLAEKFEKENKTLSEALEGLRGDLIEKSAELEALQRNKMSFEDSNPQKLAEQEIDNAVLLSKALGTTIDRTKFGSSLIEKANISAHLGSVTAEWEEEFSQRLENDIRQNLVVEPLFRKVTMNTRSMAIPVNPEAGYGAWITNASLRGTGSTGTAVDHEITDRILTAYKIAAKEYLGYEEEEDSILPLMPIVRDAVMRRMAKGVDRALLLGAAGSATGNGDTYPFDGVTTIASTAGGGQSTTLSIGGNEVVTVSALQSARKGLGVWGLNPNELVYVVSQEAYYDLLEDPDFRTMDKVGSDATILRGQIGSVNGSPVVVSGEFEPKAATKHAAVCINPANFIVGQLRNTTVETDANIEEQKNIIVATRRVGFLDIISSKGTSVVTWAA